MLRSVCMFLIASALLIAAPGGKLSDAQAKAKAGQFPEAIQILEGLNKAKPGDKEVEKTLAETHLKYGDSYMFNENLPPRQKYRPALQQYRSVLKYDKANKDATGKIKLIEGIYKSMGLPIPQ